MHTIQYAVAAAPTLERVEIGFCGDDALNIHSVMSLLLRKPDPLLTLPLPLTQAAAAAAADGNGAAARTADHTVDQHARGAAVTPAAAADNAGVGSEQQQQQQQQVLRWRAHLRTGTRRWSRT